ncbi:phage minor structural protein [Pediococcus ethanolidurans]|nr:phage minor structural protein [Pediococcus ethanolidurans]
MENVATLTLDGNGSRYWGMARDVQIGDTDNGRQWQDTLSFSCLADDINGDTVSPLGYCMWQAANSRWYLYAIQTAATSSGTTNANILTITAVNALAYDLTMKTFTDISYNMPTSRDSFAYCLQNSGWEVNKMDTMTTGGVTLDLSGDNAMSAFSAAVTAFNAEVDAYVEYDQYGNLHRYVDIVQHLYPYVNASMGDTIDEQTDVVDTNGDTTNFLDSTQGRTINYRNGLAGFTRTEDRTQLYTRLHVKGMNDATFADINGGKDWIQDDKANDLWNGGRSTYLEGTVSVDNIAQKQAIMDWGKKQLTIYNHPAFTYEITTAYMNPEDMPERGETLTVVNFDVTPNLTIIAEVFAQHTSDDNPAEDTITLGEIRTLNAITPNTVLNLENKINSHVMKLIQEIKDGSKAATAVLITPAGSVWTQGEETKSVIMQVSVDSTNITTYLSPAAFNWVKYDRVTGVHDTAWEAKHANDGYEITLDSGDVGYIACWCDDDFLKAEAELMITGDNVQIFNLTRYKAPNDHWGDKQSTAMQYAWYDQANKQVIINHAYAGSQKSGTYTDTEYCRYKLDGTLIDSMIVLGGGHGSSFACHIVDGKPEIYTSIKDISDGKNYLGKFVWKANTIIQLDKGVTKLCSMNGFKRLSVDFDNGYALTTATDGTVEVAQLSDVEAGTWAPVYTAKVQEFGMKPQDTSVDNETNTMQSNDISFPYVFVNSGASTNVDKRLLICFNIVTHSLVFSTNPDADQFGGRIFNPDDNSRYDFEPEAIGIYMNDGSPFILQGFNYELPDNSESYEYRLHIGLWTTAIEFRDDSGDVKTYPEDDDEVIAQSGGE